MAARARRGEGPRTQVAVRLGDDGIAWVDNLVTRRAAAERCGVGNAVGDVSRSEVVRRMLRFAVEHMPEDYGAPANVNPPKN